MPGQRFRLRKGNHLRPARRSASPPSSRSHVQTTCLYSEMPVTRMAVFIAYAFPGGETYEAVRTFHVVDCHSTEQCIHDLPLNRNGTQSATGSAASQNGCDGGGARSLFLQGVQQPAGLAEDGVAGQIRKRQVKPVVGRQPHAPELFAGQKE